MTFPAIGLSPQGNRERALFFLFFLVLLLGLVLGTDFFLQAQDQESRELFTLEALSQTQDLAAANEPELLIRRRILGFLPRGIKTDSAELARVSALFKKRWELPVSFYRFNGQGELISIAPLDAPQIWLMKNLYPGLRTSSPKDLDKLEKSIGKKLQFALGDDKSVEALRSRRGRIIEVFSSGSEGFLAWETSDQGGIIAFCPRLSDQRSRRIHPPAEDSRRLSVTGKLLKSGFSLAGAKSFTSGSAREDAEAAEAYTFLKKQSTLSGEFQSRWWSFQESHSGRTWYGVFPLPSRPYHQVRFLMWGMGIFLAMGVGGMVWFTPLLTRFRLRQLLVVLFLAATLIPLFGVAVSAMSSLQIAEKRRDQQTTKSQHQVLRHFATGFPGFLMRTANRLSTILEKAGEKRDGRRNAWVEKQLQRLGISGELAIRDAGGNLLHSNGSVSSPDRESLNRSIAREAIIRHSPHRQNEGSYAGNAMTDRLVRANDMGFVEILERPSTILDIVLGNSPILFYFQVFPQRRRGVAYAELRFPLLQGVTTYLRSKGRDRSVVKDPEVILYALNMETLRWTVPPPLPLRARLQDLAFRSLVSNQAQSLQLDFGGIRQSFVSLHFPKLAEHCLITMKSDFQHGDERVDRWRMGMMAFLVLVTVLAFLARNVSAALLTPLGVLEQGARALGRRDFLYRLPPGHSDEMNHLFTAFNEMMADTYDLEVAKQVQEKLLQHAFPQVKGYALAGKTAMASHLGGDFLDCHLLDDHRLLFLIGDVAGQGMASAILMAFARAVTFHRTRRGLVSPLDLVRDLDNALRQRHGGRESLGVICGILDYQRHTLEFTTHGHLYPLLLKPEGGGEWLGNPNPPLGCGKPRGDWSRSIRNVRPGEVFLGVTNGLVNSRNPEGELVGFERVLAWVQETRTDTPEEWISRILAQQAAWSGNRKDDDISVFLIRRSESES